jgi:cytoskeletal protein CcmA (bactofilin family)
MTRKLFRAGAILLLAMGAARAADTGSGKWTMAQEASNGGPPRVTTFDLRVEGTSVTGTVTAPMGGRGVAAGSDPAPIAVVNGKAKGNALHFEVIRMFAGRPATTTYDCTVSGDTMHVRQTIDLGNGPRTVEANAKRAAP